MMLSHVLKTLREAKGLTQEELAKRTGVTREYLTMLESGARRNPSLAVLQRLAKALGVSVAELLEKGRARRQPRERRSSDGSQPTRPSS